MDAPCYAKWLTTEDVFPTQQQHHEHQQQYQTVMTPSPPLNTYPSTAPHSFNMAFMHLGSPSMTGTAGARQTIYPLRPDASSFMNDDAHFLKTPSLDFEPAADHSFDDNFSIQTDNSSNAQSSFVSHNATPLSGAAYTPSCYAGPCFLPPNNPDSYDYFQLHSLIGQTPVFEEQRPEKQFKEKRHICPICLHRSVSRPDQDDATI
ncbi:hypothetical protein EC973_003676 [Apophysomyces ossiformis]|uniref:Uncharacterized protein n=1 Tax=Apophysomyces ossiformis TaxID=679940 RepID=A0A8H7EQF6_9FUNG|nr:hypothetical protein EC973_003676 [Apophysomyces ossiformis]